jgi:hypothetical protein
MRRRCPRCRRMHDEQSFARHFAFCEGARWGEPCKCGMRKAPGEPRCYRCADREPVMRELDRTCGDC